MFLKLPLQAGGALPQLESTIMALGGKNLGVVTTSCIILGAN
jgi:hypothetical protein